MLVTCNPVTTSKYCMLFWGIWGQRNKQLQIEQSLPPRQTMVNSFRLLEEWVAVNNKRVHKLNHTSKQLDSNTWVGPDVRVVKCNSDAALFQREGYTGMGCVLRNSHGEFIGCHSAKIHGVLSSRDAKAYGLRQAIIWVLKLEFPSVVFELDAKMVVDAFYATNDDNSEFGIAIKECRFLYRYKPNFFVCFTRREANKPAHKLARESYMLASPFHSALPPSCIKEALLRTKK